MADDDQTAAPPATTPTPASSPDLWAQLAPLLEQFKPQPVQVDTTPVKRSFLSLLGEGLGGGSQIPMSPADKETAGWRALQQFGTGLMAASHYSPGQTIFSNLAQGFQGAQRGMLGSEQLAASTLAGRQQFAQEQFADKMAALKEALPLLQMTRAVGLPNVLATSGDTVAPSSGGGAPASGSGVALGMRQNNPLNLEFAGQPGAQAEQGNRFATFPDMPAGVAATANQLALYQTQHGINTVQDAVKRWVSDPKADLTGYTADISKALGVKPDQPIDLTDPVVQQKFILAAQPHESAGGGAVLNPADVAKGVQLAAANRGQTVQARPSPQQFAGPGAPSGGPPVTGAPGGTSPPSPATAPPVAPPGGGAVTPPAPDTRPDAALSWEEFQARHGTPITATSRPDLVVPVDPQSEAQLQSAMAQAKADQSYAISPADKTKAQGAYTTAAEALGRLRQEAAAKTTANIIAAQKDQGAVLSPQYQKAQELAQQADQAEKNRQADIRKTELTAGYTAQQKQADADIDIAKNDITERAAESQKAGRIIPILQQMQSSLGNLPDGFIGTLLAKYDTTGDLTGILAKMGEVDPSKATAAQLLIAARNYLSIETKPAATGSLRVPEMDKLQSFTPGQLDTPQAQQEMAARLIAYQKRIQDERSFASNYFGRSSDPSNPNSPRIYDNRGLDVAMNAPVKYNQNGVVTGGGLGPVVPEPPPVSASDAEHQAYLNYVKRSLAPGAPYQTWEPKRNPDGSFVRGANGQMVPERVTKLKVPE